MEDTVLFYEKDEFYIIPKGRRVGIKNKMSFNSISKLPTEELNKIKELHCKDIPYFPLYTNQLYLPPNLLILSCANNKLSSLPLLPKSLLKLYCQNNKLSSLPNLPQKMTHLYCQNNKLSSLPDLPQKLIDFNCQNNSLDFLPTLPDGLFYLHCENNNLSSLPLLPDGLAYLHCNHNKLEDLSLNSNLDILDIGYNNFVELPNLPQDLTHLNCQHNKISIITNLPNDLSELICSFNPITQISLPQELTLFECTHSNLILLPKLPDTLKELKVSHNKIRKIPKLLPTELEYIDLTYNDINHFTSSFQVFTRISNWNNKDTLYTLKLNHNPFIKSKKELEKYKLFTNEFHGLKHDYDEIINKEYSNKTFFNTKLLKSQLTKLMNYKEGPYSLIEEYARPIAITKKDIKRINKSKRKKEVKSKTKTLKSIKKFLNSVK